MTTRPKAIDLFSGVGGMSLGFEQAGFDIVSAVEIDPVHAAAHHYNFPNCTLIPHSVTGLTGDSIREKAGLGDAQIDLVCGGAPCQGFSLIGKRVIDDPRNLLVRDFVRLVKELDARSFVFENVKGLTVGKHKKFLKELIQEFTKAGYDVLIEPMVLNAAHYGVPQHRERLFLLGVKKGQTLPSYPLAITRKPKDPEENGIPCVATAIDAIGDLPNAESFSTLNDKDSVTTSQWGPLSSYGKEMRCFDDSAWHNGYERIWQPDRLTSSLRTKHTSISRRRFKDTPMGEVEPISRFYKLAADGISNTLRAGTDASRGAFTSPRPIHYKYHRCVTVREMARLHGFPDWFRFHRTKWHGARQIGNAVPPPLARAVACQMMNALGYEPTKPDEVITLGDEMLLAMDMSLAVKHWGVEAPISKRDRKSGSKKRKQKDIEAERINAMAAE